MSSPEARSARQLAWEALQRVDHLGAYANLVLPALLESSQLSREDRAFTTDLVYGTTRMRRACDAAIDRFITSEPEPSLRTLFRLGTYQLLFGGTAPHAAVSETVALAPRRLRGFVNAVLRRIATSPMQWSSEAEELSYPEWIVKTFQRELGVSDARASLEVMNRAAPVTRRADGYVQDPSSQWVVEAVGARAGELVLDVCAGPGGKATGLAHTGAKVVAADVHRQRADLVARNAALLNLPLAVVAADGRHPPFRPDVFDRVLVDAPCSGLGALRRRPDARWRISPRDIDDLVALQSDLLARAAQLVRPGGVLIYSVCTITERESIGHRTPTDMEVVERGGDAKLPPLGSIWRDFGSGYRVLPHDHRAHGSADDDERALGSDGMTLVRYRRKG